MARGDIWFWVILGLALTAFAPAWADGASLSRGGAVPLFDAHGSGLGLANSARPLVMARSAGMGTVGARPSLFDFDRSATGATRVPPTAERLLALIARAEAGRAGYDAVQHGARIPPPRAPTQMRLQEIVGWIAATPGQPHAIGRYQFIPPTLERVVRLRGLPMSTRFSADVQDDLALVLLQDAGFADFEAGRLPRAQFMHNLARIWAGLPLPNGRSHYHGHAGNRATMTWAAFDTGMAEIWPHRR